MAERKNDDDAPPPGGELTRVDASKERKIVSLGDPNRPRHGVSRTVTIAVLILLTAAGGMAVYRHMSSADGGKATNGHSETNGESQPAGGTNNETNGSTAEPKVPDNFVFSPEFEISTGTFNAGSAFVVKLNDHARPLVLTALHLFGPAGGLPRQISAAEIPTFVKHASFYNVFDNEEQVCSADIVIPLPGAAPFDQNSTDGDVVAFLINLGANVPSVSLAAHAPKPGDVVYLAARVAGGAPPTQRLHRGIVVSGGAQSFSYKFDNQALNITGTSGAPVLNQNGNVVGINLGTIDEGGKLCGFAHAVERFKTQLIAGVKDFEAREKFAKKDPALPESKTTQINPQTGKPTIIDDIVLGVGQPGRIGNTSVEVEHFWVDAGQDGQPSYAALSAVFANVGNEPAALPNFEVMLLDAEGRQYKPSKNKSGGGGVLNPMVKVRNFWAFQLAPEVIPTHALFKIREGSVRVDLNKHTPENGVLIASEEFAPTLQELYAFASPRYVLRQQYEKAQAEADATKHEIDAVNRDIAKINKKSKQVNDAYDTAKAALEKIKKDISQGVNRTQRDIDKAVDDFKKRESVWQEQEKELKDLNTKIKTLTQKLEQQQKAADTLKQKVP